MSGPSRGSNASPGKKNCLIWAKIAYWGTSEVRRDNEQPDYIITGADVSVCSSPIHISGVSYESELQGHLKGKHLLKPSQNNVSFVRGVKRNRITMFLSLTLQELPRKVSLDSLGPWQNNPVLSSSGTQQPSEAD